MSNMTIVNVYDSGFNLIGVVDSYVSVIWRPAYYDIGDFELYLGASNEALDLLQKNRILVRASDVSVDGSGNTIYRNPMIIKNIELITDIENGDFLSITGRELKFILHQRIIWTQTNLSGTAEGGIRQLVNDNAVNPTDTKRKIPNLVLGAESGLSDTIKKQLTGDYLDEAITEICTAFNYGWEIYGYNGNYVFIVYKGIDRSYGQSVNPYVVFSDNFENLYNTDYQLFSEEYCNTALIGGEGEGTERTYTTVNNSATGLNRYELFVDAKDLSSNKDSANVIPPEQYLQLLAERGQEKLAEKSITEGFSGEVSSDSASNYVYGEDFDIGDTVTVINSYGITKNVMVLSSIESEDESGKKLIPQFNL